MKNHLANVQKINQNIGTIVTHNGREHMVLGVGQEKKYPVRMMDLDRDQEVNCQIEVLD